MNASLDSRVLLTLSYTDQFQFPLSAEEIWLRLTGGNNTTLGKADVKKSLQRLLKKKLIEAQGSHYALRGSGKSFAIRSKRASISKDKQGEVDGFVSMINWLPWVKGVVLTGSLAMNNVRQENDIDFMIVTSSNRVWLSRLLVSILTLLKNKRRSSSYEKANSWCFNLWLDEDHLELLTEKKSLYSAYEACQTRWVLSRGGVEQQFLQNNRWIRTHLFNYYSLRTSSVDSKMSTTKELTPTRQQLNFLQSLLNPLFDFLDLLAYFLQKTYMLPHMTRERVERGFAYFHPRDTRALIYNRWRESLRRLI